MVKIVDMDYSIRMAKNNKATIGHSMGPMVANVLLK